MSSPRIVTVLAAIAWVCLLVGLIGRSARRDGAPGDPGSTPGEWPRASSLALARDGLTLVMALSSQSPGSAASSDELERLVHDDPALHAYVLVVVPEGAPSGF